MLSEQQIGVVREEVREELANAITHGFESHGFARTISLT